MPTPLVVGNWKMNGLASALAVLDTIVADVDEARAGAMICPPATLIASAAARVAGSRLKIGAQDCHAAATGAHTGDVSAEMLHDAGAVAVILGHSERRADHGETDADVRAKVEGAWRAGLMAIVCVGETEAERDAGEAVAVVERQLAGSLPDGATARATVIAYEPVWAIGTGRVAEVSDVAEMHGAMRAALSGRFGAEGSEMRLLYGGSVKPSNAAGIFAVDDVDGALVGGASLKAADFLAILRAAG